MTPHIIVLRRFYFALLLLVATVVNVRAQFYPVQVTPQLVPPYSVYLSDYATPGSEKLRVIVLQRDLTQPAYQLRLVMSVEWNGKVIMRTSRAFTPPPINIDPGIPTVISGVDLAPYLDSRNIDFVGYSRDQYEKTRALPEGSYRIFFTAYDYRRQDVQVSNEGSSFYYLSKNEPPLINFPACGTKIPLKTPQQIVFSWLPRNTASPYSVAETEYEFALYETRPAGRNPNDVVLSTQPVFRTRTDIPQLVYGPAEPVLLENMKYVWRVQAIDKNGRDAFRNNGFSEVCTFTYGGVDPTFDIGVVKNLQAIGETERRGKISWEAANYDSYKVYYKKTGTGYEWFSSDVKNTELKLFDLEPDTEYETRVQVRKSGVFGPYSEIVKFRTTPRRVLACGQDAGTLAQGDESKPLLAATRGMTIDVDGMEVMLLDVAPLGSGWYKGMGTVTTKLLGASFHVKFDRLFIDDSHVAGFGKIEFLTKGVAELVQQQIANQQRKNDQKQQEENREQWEGTDFQEKIFRYDNIVITDISFENGVMVITDAEGKTYANTEVPQMLIDAPEKAIIIEDKNGDQYVAQKDPVTGETKVTKVTGGGLPPVPGSKIVDREYNLKLKFTEAPLAKYGFDERKYDALAQDYEQLEGSYNVPWKAVATGATDGVTAKLDDNSIDKSKVRFELSSVSIPTPPLGGDQTTSVTIFGKGDGDVEELFALYTPVDTTQKEQVLGKLKVISYNKIVRNLVLVPVNSTTITVDAPTLQQELNKIYGQAAVQWQVRSANTLNVTYDANNDGLEFGNSGIFSNYTDEMRTIINEYKRMDASAPANETYYLFFVPNASDQNVRGFMPRKKQMGFIFTEQLSGSNLIKTIGHELAHGAFRLEHTFPVLPENGNNLLDRSTTGTYLHKYQWDLVHNPVAVLGLFEGDEEGASKTLFDSKYVRLHDDLSLNAWASTKGKDAFTQDIASEVDSKLEVLDKEGKLTYILINYAWFDASNISKFEERMTNLSTNAKSRLGKELGKSDFNLLVVVNAKYDTALAGGLKGVSFREWFYPMNGLETTCIKAFKDYLNDDSKKKFTDGLNEALKERAKKLLEKLKGCKVERPKEIVIRYKRKGHNKYRTWGEFTIDGTEYKGYILERPKGSNPTTLQDYKRHPAGTYNIGYSEDSGGDAKFNNVTLYIVENPSYKLHCGNRADQSDGCLLINFSSPQLDKYPDAYQSYERDINKPAKQREENPNRLRPVANSYPAKFPDNETGSSHDNPNGAAYQLRKKVKEMEDEIKLQCKCNAVVKKIVIDETEEKEEL